MDNECRKRILSEDYADFMIYYGTNLDSIREKFDACYDKIVEETFNVYVPLSQVREDFIHDFGYSAFPNVYGVLSTSSMEASGVTKIRSIPRLSLRGQGVLVGIVDTGIDYLHEAFRYGDNTTKIHTIWDQTIESADGSPQGFYFGTEYTREQINEALKSEQPLTIVPSVDTNGHGTFLAGVAAGNESAANDFIGVAPDAELIIVKMKQAKRFIRNFWKIPDGVECFQKNDLMSGIRYLVETAEKAKKPLSLIIGVGTSQGAHDEKGALSSYLTTLANMSGMAVTIAGGNEGNRSLHYSGTVKSPENMDTIELNVATNSSGFTIELWGNTPTTFSIDLISPSGEYVPRIPARLKETREVRFIFERTVINVDYEITEAQSGDQLILLRFLNPSEGIWRIRVYSGGNLTLNYHAWLPIYQFLQEGTYFIKADPYYTLTSPGNVTNPIVTTAYNHSSDSLYLYASRGYTRTNGIAPTLAAPGVNIVVPVSGGGYTTATGTSISAAHTGGIGALFLEWGVVNGNYQQISTVEIRNLLIRGARRKKDMSYPNKEWGYGILDIFEAFNSLRNEKL